MKFNIQKLSETASTNDDAKQAAAAGAPEGTVIWALSQSAGRGRQGRQWVSPEGNLYCSVVLRPTGGLPDYGFYSFIAALAIFDAVREFLPAAPIELKWPNDVLVAGRKISGILLEAGDGYLIAGIGLNILHIPENPLYPVTSLAAEITPAPQLTAVVDSLLASLGRWINIYKTQGFAPVRQAWLDRARKGAMHVRLPNIEIKGEFAGLDDNGNLRLLLPDGTTQSISAGDIFF